MKRITSLSFILPLAAVMITLWACQAPPTGTTPPTSAPVNVTPPQAIVPPSIPFTADGIIQPGEYTDNQTYSDYQIYWKNDDKYVYIAMKAKTNGFVAVGLQPGVTMLDADIILGFVKDGKAQVYDMYSTGAFGPHPQDTELGGTNDILQSGGTDDGQYTTIEFKRLLDTGDKYDLALVKGVNRIIWSYGPNKDPNLKHTNRGYGEIVIK